MKNCIRNVGLCSVFHLYCCQRFVLGVIVSVFLKVFTLTDVFSLKLNCWPSVLPYFSKTSVSEGWKLMTKPAQHQRGYELNTCPLLCSNYPFSHGKCLIVYTLFMNWLVGILQISSLLCPAVVCLHAHPHRTELRCLCNSWDVQMRLNQFQWKQDLFF